MRRPRRGASSEVRARSFSAASCLETRFRAVSPFCEYSSSHTNVLQRNLSCQPAESGYLRTRHYQLISAAILVRRTAWERQSAPSTENSPARIRYHRAEKAYRQATAHSQRIDRLWPEMDGFFNWRSDRKDTRILGEQMDAIDTPFRRPVIRWNLSPLSCTVLRAATPSEQKRKSPESGRQSAGRNGKRPRCRALSLAGPDAVDLILASVPLSGPTHSDRRAVVRVICLLLHRSGVCLDSSSQVSRRSFRHPQAQPLLLRQWLTPEAKRSNPLAAHKRVVWAPSCVQSIFLPDMRIQSSL